MLTLRDIAVQVGVSPSTVSLVLNDRDAGRVKAETAEKVRRIAYELGYVPNQLARSLKKGQTHTIGLVSDRVATVPFSGHMLAGAQRTAWDAGYLLLLIDTAGNDALQRPAVRSLLQRNVEALIFATTYHRVVELPDIPASIPIVLLDGKPAGSGRAADFVVPDEQGGARTGTNRLIEAGHRRIGFIDVPSYPVASTLRRAGYRQALADAGIGYRPEWVVDSGDADTGSARAAARALLDRPDRPTAVFCFGDQIALGVYQVAQHLGLTVPTDLSVVGFDNQEFVAEAMDPGLTTVQLPHAAMGEWAAARALARITGAVEGADVEGRLMPCPIVVRDSVAPPY